MMSAMCQQAIVLASGTRLDSAWREAIEFRRVAGPATSSACSNTLTSSQLNLLYSIGSLESKAETKYRAVVANLVGCSGSFAAWVASGVRGQVKGQSRDWGKGSGLGVRA